MSRAAMFGVLAGVLVAAGCGSAEGALPTDKTSEGATTPLLTTVASAGAVTNGTPTAVSNAAFHVVVVGDSLAIAKNGCSDCTGFVDQFTAHVAEVLGSTAASDTLTPGGVPEAQRMLTSDSRAKALVAAADVVVVEVGANNALPDPETGIGCPGSLSSGYVTWMLTTNDACLAQGVATYGQLYDEVFATIKTLRAGRPTAYIVTNSIDGNIDPSVPDGLLAIAGDQVDEVKAWTVRAYDRWNAMVAERAAAAGFAVADVYHEFNGPTADHPYPSLAGYNGGHLSQAGNDVFANALAELDPNPLRP